MEPQLGKTFRELTTFRIGGKIRAYFEVRNPQEISEAVHFAKKRKLQIFVLGGGSDILVSDKDFNGVVIKYVAKGSEIRGLKSGGVRVVSNGGEIWDDLVAFAVKNNLQGIECLSGIPGTVGAAPVQNVGAYGQELKDVFAELSAYDIDDEKLVKFGKEDCEFSYRESIFKKQKYRQRFIITEVTLNLRKGERPAVKYDSLGDYLSSKGIENPGLKQVRSAVLDIRSRKFESPEKFGNAGSFFKNPVLDKAEAKRLKSEFPEIPLRQEPGGKVKGSAGWFIEKAGWKGKVLDGAKVSDMHALILLNHSGDATAGNVLGLAERIAGDVNKKFGITLEKEVQLINF